MQAPFPYFGGKATIAHIVWSALGDVKHYMEPFFGSGAVLLSRPDYDYKKHIETICDKDGHIANVWRALKSNPDEVANWADWPVNHADLSARKKRMIETMENGLLGKLIEDDDYYDAKMAGYWIWAASCWIGKGLTRPGQRPHLATAGMGVHKLKNRNNTICQIPHLSSAGNGVHKLSLRNESIYSWFNELSERLRYVRVVCGDWTRVCGGNWQDGRGTIGIFFDPPYSAEGRDNDIYHHDSTTVANDVRAWCLNRGNKESYRIVLAGYDEHSELLYHGWTAQNWKAQGGYGRNARDKANTRGIDNRNREMLYFSPHCIKQPKQNSLF